MDTLEQLRQELNARHERQGGKGPHGCWIFAAMASIFVFMWLWNDVLPWLWNDVLQKYL